MSNRESDSQPAGGDSGGPPDLLALMRDLSVRLDKAEDPQAMMAQVIDGLAALRTEIEQTDADALFRSPEAQAKLHELAAQLGIEHETLEDADLARASQAAQQAKPDMSAALGALMGMLQEVTRGAKSMDDLAQALDEKTGGAYSQYRAKQQAETIDRVATRARQSATRSAQQVKPDLDVSEWLRQMRADAGEDQPKSNPEE